MKEEGIWGGEKSKQNAQIAFVDSSQSLSSDYNPNAADNDRLIRVKNRRIAKRRNLHAASRNCIKISAKHLTHAAGRL
jgi:hypothetical protein